MPTQYNYEIHVMNIANNYRLDTPWQKKVSSKALNHVFNCCCVGHRHHYHCVFQKSSTQSTFSLCAQLFCCTHKCNHLELDSHETIQYNKHCIRETQSVETTGIKFEYIMKYISLPVHQLLALPSSCCWHTFIFYK